MIKTKKQKIGQISPSTVKAAPPLRPSLLGIRTHEMKNCIETVSRIWSDIYSKADTVEPQINEPLYNEVRGIPNDILQAGQRYSKMYGTEPRYNEPRYNEIVVITSTIQKPTLKCISRFSI